MFGPVSSTLKQQVLAEAQSSGLLVWLDKDGLYTDFVDALKSTAKTVFVTGFRESFLALMLELEERLNGLQAEPLIIHMPGFNEQSIADTPIFEHYEAGKRYRVALNTVITDSASGRVAPVDIDEYLKSPTLTLKDADLWLERRLQVREQGLRAQLKTHSTEGLATQLLNDAAALRFLTQPETMTELLAELERRTGLDAAWRRFVGAPCESLPDVAYHLYSWALSVEYVHDLKRAPFMTELQRLGKLPKKTITVCCQLAQALRRQNPESYVRIADDFEDCIKAQELQRIRPQDLGRIDTFREEELRVFAGAIEALGQGDWSQVLKWCQERLGEAFWVERDATRKAEWALVDHAAKLGLALAQNPVVKGDSVEAMLDQYHRQGFEVDRAQRRLEQRRKVLLESQLKHFAALRRALDGLRELYRAWADALSRQFLALCEEQGFLITESKQQRHVFERWVRPLTEQGRVAFFMVDALRFEMAVALREQLQKAEPRAEFKLSAALSELPSDTSVGMNALCPVTANGHLRPVLKDGAIEGFQSQTYQVKSKDERKRSMHARVQGTNCPWYELKAVLSSDVARLKKVVAQARLLIVHSLEIDKAGEAGLGLSVFEQTLRELRNAWSKLREAGVQSFVFCSDHGFLLNDDKTLSQQSFGNKRRPKRRSVYLDSPESNDELVSVSLLALQYDQAPGYFAFPRSTAVFDRGDRETGFVHGGPSLQERAIPILSVVHAQQQGSHTTSFSLSAEAGDEQRGMHCLKIKAGVSRGMPFEKVLELALRVVDDEQVRIELCSIREHGHVGPASFTVDIEKPVELFFKLEGPSRKRVAIEVFHPAAGVDVAPVRALQRFGVTTRLASEPETKIEERGEGDRSWLADFKDEGGRKIFEHLDKHGRIQEHEAVNLLGSARKFRRFALKFEEYQALAPFMTRIEASSSGKVYIKEN